MTRIDLIFDCTGVAENSRSLALHHCRLLTLLRRIVCRAPARAEVEGGSGRLYDAETPAAEASTRSGRSRLGPGTTTSGPFGIAPPGPAPDGTTLPVPSFHDAPLSPHPWRGWLLCPRVPETVRPPTACEYGEATASGTPVPLPCGAMYRRLVWASARPFRSRLDGYSALPGFPRSTEEWASAGERGDRGLVACLLCECHLGFLKSAAVVGRPRTSRVSLSWSTRD